jgi:hypothetical protein
MTPLDLMALLTQARENNRQLQITGMLLYHKQNFLQVLEGNKTVIEDLFKRIVRDTRHDSVTLLVKRPIQHREYSRWEMKFTNLDELDLSKIPGYAPYRNLPDSNPFEASSFSYNLLTVFRDL